MTEERSRWTTLTELVDLLRHIADEIEAVGLMREAKAGE